MEIIPAISSKSLTKYTILDNYILIADAYYKLKKLYGMENITTEEVMYKLGIFQVILEKVDEYDWWNLERTQTDSG